MKTILYLCMLLLSAAVYAQKPVFTQAAVKAATVYYNAAELTQSASVILPAGSGEIIIKNVADRLDENSVRISAPASVTILSVQFTRDYISEYEPDETSPTIKKVRDSIALVQKAIERTANAKTAEIKTLELLDKNNQVYGQQSGLSVAELMKMVEYYKAKRTETANTINILAEKEQKLNEKLEALKNKLDFSNRITEKASQGKLVLQVMNTAAGTIPIEVSYITPSASWKPFYDLRVESTATPINMMYKAQVTQSTGVDWKKIKLTLSSGTPNQNNQAPLLQAWFLQHGTAADKTIARFTNTLQGQVSGLAISTADVSLEKASVSAYTTVTENQLSTSFDIDIPYDILSNGKAHSVSMKELQLPARYRHYTAPRLESVAFLMAELQDYSSYNLLPGEANIIFEEMYIGKTFIDPNQTADTLNLSMGRDRRISVKREKVAEKSGSRFLSGIREQTFTYDITLRNNKKDTVRLMVKDQYPVSTDKEVEVELLQSDKAKVNAESGILTWEVDLKPGETRKLRMSYKVRHPKDKPVANL